MNQDTPRRDMTKLSAKQQIGLYVILTKLYGEKNRPFFSSDFAEEMERYLKTNDSDEYKKIIGGILGALSKNGIIRKITGDRDPLWILPDDIYQITGDYKKAILPVVTHWEQ